MTAGIIVSIVTYLAIGIWHASRNYKYGDNVAAGATMLFWPIWVLRRYLPKRGRMNHLI